MKNSFENHIDKFFRDLLQFHKKEPGKHIWENIEKELETEDKVAFNKTNNKELKKISVLLVLFFFLSSTFVYYRVNLVQRPGAVASGNKINSAMQKTASKPLEIFATVPVPVNPNNFVKQRFPDEIGNKADEIGNMNFSVISPDAGFAPVHLGNIFQSVPLPMTNPKSIQSSANQSVTRLQQSKFMDRISITPYFSKEFAGYNFTDNDSTAPNGKEVEKAERNIFSASVGVYVNYKINKRWMVQTGISYSWSRSIMDSSQSYAVRNATGEVAFKLNTSSGFSYLHSPSFIVPMVGDSIGTAKTHSELHYLTVPLIVSYRIPVHRFTFLAGAGMTFNFLTKATLETDIYGVNYKQNESEIPIRGLKKMNTGLLLKAEVQYQLNSKISVSLIPSFKNTLGPINMNSSSLSAYPYNFGIGAGIVFSF
jgi:hypothetical protein